MIDFVRDNSLSHPESKSTKAGEALSKKAYALHQKGDGHFLASRFEESKKSYQESLETYRKAGDSHGMALSLGRLGRTAEMLGEYFKAREAYAESRGIFQGLGDKRALAGSMAHLGNVSWATGAYEEAGKILDEALTLYRETGDVPGQAWVLDLMGNLKLALREDQAAEELHRAAFAIAQRQGASLENTAWNHYHQGALALYRGQGPEAAGFFLKALEDFGSLKDVLGRVASLIHLGEIACAQGNLSTAEIYLEEAVRLVLPSRCKPLLADALTGVAQVLKARGDERKAVGILMVALSHPTCRQQTKDRMVALAMTLQPAFSPKEAESGFQWAKDVDMEQMAIAWAASVAPKLKGKKR